MKRAKSKPSKSKTKQPKSKPPKRALARARRSLTRKHPQIKGVRVRITAGKRGTYTLSFKTSTRLPDGATLHQTLRATINETGDVLRVVTSR